jgi:hypothetical protein
MNKIAITSRLMSPSHESWQLPSSHKHKYTDLIGRLSTVVKNIFENKPRPPEGPPSEVVFRCAQDQVLAWIMPGNLTSELLAGSREFVKRYFGFSS